MSRIRILFTAAVLSAVCALWLVARTSMPEPSPIFAVPAPPALPDLEEEHGAETLRGRVVDAHGAPVAEAFVQTRAGELLQWTYTDADGRFELDRLLPGPIELNVVAEGHPPDTFATELPVPQGPRGTGDVELVLAGPRAPIELLPAIARSDLAARALGPGGEPLEGWEIVLSPDEAADPLGGAVQRRERADATGAATFFGLAHASYRAELLPPWAAGGDWPVLASASWTQPPIPREAGTPPASGLELQAQPGSIAGSLVDPAGHALVGALILAHSLVDARRVWPPGRTDGDGRFRIDHLPPGRYAVRLLAGVASQTLEFDVDAGQSVQLPVLSLDPTSVP